MYFKNPEILWALFLLLIPIIVHLFQLRRFQKEAFTNVKFLKFVKLQTRKSSQLKKWLTLLARLGLLACVIIAFAQPFTSTSNNLVTTTETVIYLDNSFSMEVKGKNGSLLNEAIIDLVQHLPEDKKITLFTNDAVFADTNLKAIKNELIGLKYSPSQLNYNSAILKGKNYFSKDASSTKNLVLISDFQQKEDNFTIEQDTTIAIKLVQPKPVLANNTSIDSLFISNTTYENHELTVELSHQGDGRENTSVSLYNNSELVSKTSVDITEQNNEVTFTIPNNASFNGSVVIDDASLKYDNNFYFNINETDKINVLSINEASDDFLKRLYTEDEFVFTSFSTNTLEYNLLEDQNVIILNELESIPFALVNNLKVFLEKGGSVLIIPGQGVALESYNNLFGYLNLPQFITDNKSEKLVTSINYDHPLLQDAFYKRVSNFQYPKVNTHFSLSNSGNSIFRFEDNTPFLTASNKAFLFVASLNAQNTNFKKSPLIVPALYNIAKQSLATPKLYYSIGKANNIDIKTVLAKDDILHFENDTEHIIPLQQTFTKKVSVTTGDYPKTAGIFNVKNKNNTLTNISFNYSRDESNLSYYNLNGNEAYSLDTSVAKTIEDIKSNERINALWKWFVIFALVFLLIEILLLKYLK